ncbi:MAG: response regulator [Oscillatoriaceae bacterium SKW80]|nr:response regulator [Oscillatoriaceae bacterium SKYG93]MCX8121030.1 response regulator [Oscillatoriaceae bacterium SKW80]MDW8452303.1 response regulator [Oscillatoriaceae cyanobacterium SKYGB_i_bin93]HIK26637.1 response regulator [Oscillatoriaceae cyanobacterium M7585_C2015_266]
MDIANPELENIKRQLMSLMRPKKPKMLVVDDEPDNLDLLYRTFRREFQVLKAESGVRALEILAKEGEVAVIISDQRMPEMKGTEFLKKTLPQFPNTVRIILTGFTDIEDLVEAINSGQVYKYITKPWDPNELKAVVEKAAENYNLLIQRMEELRIAQIQTNLIEAIVQAAQKAESLLDCLQQIATAFGKNFAANVCILQMVSGGVLASEIGAYGNEAAVDNWLEKDPLVKEAIATQKIQGVLNIPTEPSVADIEHYKSSSIQSHIVLPIAYRNRVLAILSLQWRQPCPLREDEINLVYLSAQQVALAINSACTLT